MRMGEMRTGPLRFFGGDHEQGGGIREATSVATFFKKIKRESKTTLKDSSKRHVKKIDKQVKCQLHCKKPLQITSTTHRTSIPRPLSKEIAVGSCILLFVLVSYITFFFLQVVQNSSVN